MNNLVIRKAFKKDINDIFFIQRSNWLLVYPNEVISKDDILKFLDSIKDFQKQKLEETIEDEKYYYVAEIDGKVVGYCRYKETEPHIFELRSMYIDLTFQGLGIGTKMFLETEKSLANKKKLFLFVVEYNIKAIRFYENIGFVLSSKEKQTLQIGENKFITNVKMIYGKQF